MRFGSLAEAASIVGKSKDAIGNRGARGTWPRHKDPTSTTTAANNRRFLYGIPETQEEAEELNVKGWGDDVWEAGPSFTADNEPRRRYVSEEEEEIQDPESTPYTVIGDKYVFNLPSKPRHPWAVSKGEVEQLVSMYSNDGDGASLNQISRAMGWHRKTVKEMLRALGKTHDSLPFTDEQIADGEEAHLVEDLIRQKEEKIHVRAAKVDWRKTQELADKARRWDKFISASMSQMVVPPAPDMPQWKVDRIRGKHENVNKISVVSHASDLHYGKEGWVNQTGEESNREHTRDTLMYATEKLIKRIKAWGEPDEVILGAGGDWFHIDNHRGTTTRGTPMDHDGSFLQIFSEGCALARDHIEMWRQAIPKVRIVTVRGNHDYYSTALLVHWLQAKYEDSPDVEVGRCEIDREYLKVGNTILGLTHGDGVKDKDLVSLMAAEAKDLWSHTKYRLWLTGHWHSQISYEHHGVLVEHLPSLAGTDAWHNKHGYKFNKKDLMAHLIDHEDGIIAKVWAGFE